MNESIYTTDDLLNMLDSLLRDEGKWWDGFYSDRDKGIPFFVNVPDESLVNWFERGLIKPGRVLELGCGPGRNAVYMAKQGCEVDAVDVSPVAIEWAKERARDAGVEVNFTCDSIFNLAINPESYDIVYDAGCFHHIPPHRRLQFVPLIARALKPGGLFCLTCMNLDKEMGGSDISDWEVYRGLSMKGGLGYTLERLRTIFCGRFEEIELRQMQEINQPAESFGKDFLWVGLFKKR